MRLDKYLANAGLGSRKEVKKLLRKELITVNDKIIKDESYQVLPTDLIKYLDKEIIYHQKLYLMLNKPAGVICATTDNYHQTVIDLIKDFKQTDLFPVGRLDIETVGLLLITNDGKFAHEILAPTKHVDKKYYVSFDGEITLDKIKQLEAGLIINLDNENYLTKPAKYEVINKKSGYLTISEGKFHQVKKMFQAVNLEVLYLKRVAFGQLVLDETLEEGQYRLLTSAEKQKLKLE